MSGEARALNYYNYGTAAPTIKAMVEAETRRIHVPPVTKDKTQERVRRLEKVKAVAEAKTFPGISVFAVLGTLFVSVLMIFVVLAQVNYNETAGEAAKLNTQLIELTEKHKALELAFESVIDIKEVERFARDELGMSRPNAEQVIVISTTPRDTAMVVDSGEERGMEGFGTFLRSLTEYFR